MGELTKIQWAHDTFNPWIGCAKVSAGCTNCYAEVNTFARRSRANGLELWGAKAERHVTSDENWKKPLRWNREAAASGEPRRVFCASLCDVFEDRPDLNAPRARLHALIRDTPHLTWMLLTKRPENADRLWRQAHYDAFNGADSLGLTWAPNVWLGTTAEDQRRANERIRYLLRAPASVRFVSAEPLLGPIDLDLAVSGSIPGRLEWQAHAAAPGIPATDRAGIDWVIIGGESGSKARPCALEWIERLVAQCRRAGVATFVKQLGAYVVSEQRTASLDVMGGSPSDYKKTDYAPSGEIWAWRAGLADPKGGDIDAFPDDLRVREWPAKHMTAERPGP